MFMDLKHFLSARNYINMLNVISFKLINYLIVIVIKKIKKQENRKMQSFSQSHNAIEWVRHDLDSGVTTPRSIIFPSFALYSGMKYLCKNIP